jgi:hypothetical protein
MWVVMGETGAYDDYCDWMVCAYTTEAEAEKHAQAAQNWWVDNFHAWHDAWPGEWVKNPYDLMACRPDYTGTKYHVFEIELKTEFVPSEAL